jgi:hypothetical protein
VSDGEAHTMPLDAFMNQIMQTAGLISYRRGHVTIVDRPGLEKMSCECYATVTANFQRLLPELPPMG